MLKLPTGAGKTTIASEMIRGVIGKNKRALFICERITLVEQAAQRFSADGLQVSIMQANNPFYDPRLPVQAASIQTLARRKWPYADVIFIDEAHILYKVHKDIMDKWNNIPVIGLSATPWAKGLGKYFQDVVSNVEVQDLIDQGYLVDSTIYGPAKPNMSGVKTVRGEYEEKGSVKEATKIIGDVVSHWLKLGRGRPTAMFCVNIAHSKALVHEFIEAGVKAAHVDAYSDSDERRRIFKAFDKGEIEIISSVDVIGRGWDQPKVSCLLLCRPTKSRIVHVQQIGRGMRTHESKEDCLILDFAGNHERLGFVTDPIGTKLDTSDKIEVERVEKERLPKICPSCKFIKPVGIHACPKCGFAPEKKNDVEHEDGELVAVKIRKYTMEEKISIYGQLKSICVKHGYNPGWIAHKYQTKTGVWPNHPSIKNAPAMKPTDEILNWVRSQNIRHAYRRK